MTAPSTYGLSTQARNLQWLLTDLVEEVPGVNSVAVVSSDGLLLLSSDPVAPDTPALGAATGPVGVGGCGVGGCGEILHGTPRRSGTLLRDAEFSKGEVRKLHTESGRRVSVRAGSGTCGAALRGDCAAPARGSSARRACPAVRSLRNSGSRSSGRLIRRGCCGCPVRR
ncbi:roadblock/LC7 domain-containing protein [Streptomyces sp. ICC4]|uniref:roadblock/LC7 domain-containing protein n=1 Tax=Streptomyces sp. ICC4 TaxID=2099584 RepID=UPI0023B7F866|nr:roadblock/LC7 domain-containing protein [Streptomyces sp. ICC4]